MLQAGNFPPGVTKIAGPWVSNEETKLVLVLDIQDHTTTVPAFWGGITHGHVKQRRFTPLVEWETVKDAIVKM